MLAPLADTEASTEISLMTHVPSHQTFIEAYAGEAPWDIGRPQEPLVRVAEQVVSPVLDAGCGTGDASLYFAERGHQVVGIDYLKEPIRRARAKAAERGLTVDFRVADALTLDESGERFATALDCGLFHCFTDEDRRRYVRGLAHVLEPGGRLFLMCFSDAEPPGQGPRRVSRQELVEAFADGWEIESIEPTQFALNPKFTGADSFSPGGPHAWFASVQRTAKGV
jgi:SAM-dependent methyltransferase